MIKKCLYLITILFCLFVFNAGACAGEIAEPSPLDFLSFVKYHVIDSVYNGDINSRTIKLEITNTTSQTLYDVKAYLEGLPEFISSSDPVVHFGEINPYQTSVSTDTFQISIDTSQFYDSQLELVWTLKCGFNGEYIIDETAVIEKLQ